MGIKVRVKLRLTWEEHAVLVAMQGNVAYSGVGIEHLLRAVAMVNVPVNNQYPLHVISQQLLGCYGNVIEIAEAPSNRKIIKLRVQYKQT